MKKQVVKTLKNAVDYQKRTIKKVIPKTDDKKTHIYRKKDILHFSISTLPKLCFSVGLVDEILAWQEEMKRENYKNYKYIIVSSIVPEVFNLGGDLEHFVHCIETSDKEQLREYAYKCVDCVYNFVKTPNHVTSICVIEGSALGGGLEAALTADIVIAEEDSKLGFPEVKFNLFPGMGGYHLVTAKANEKLALEMIRKGKIYTPRELHKEGLVDFVTENGNGHKLAKKIISDLEKGANPAALTEKIRQFKDSPLLNREDLIETVDEWIDKAFEVSRTDIKTMKKLVAAQQKILAKKKIRLKVGSYLKRKKIQLTT